FLLTVLGHYGMMLATLAIMGLFGVWALLFQGRAGQARGPAPTGGQAWWVLGAFGVALAGSFGVYYWRFLAEMWAQWSGVLGAAAVALLSGRYFGLLLSRGRAARCLVALSLAAMLAHLLGFWVGDLIFTRYH